MASRSLNKVFLIGNLTRDPEVRYTSSGAAMCSFGLATNRTWKGADGELKEEAEFHNLVAWNKMAEVCYQILAKGMKVFVEGELRTRTWDDEAGETKYRTEIKVNEMILLDSRGKTGVGGGQGEEGGVTVEDVEGGSSVSEEAPEEGNAKAPRSNKPARKPRAEKGPKAKAAPAPEMEADSKDILDDDLPF